MTTFLLQNGEKLYKHVATHGKVSETMVDQTTIAKVILVIILIIVIIVTTITSIFAQKKSSPL